MLLNKQARRFVWLTITGYVAAGALLVGSVRADFPRFLFGDPRLAEGINTPTDDDRSPSMTADGLEFYFWRGGTDGVFDPFNPDIRMYSAKRSSRNEPFGTPTVIAGIDTPDRYELTPEISPDGLTLYYATNRGEDRAGPLTVWSATRATRDLPFGQPVELMTTADLPDPTRGIFDPSISADGLTLYMTYEKSDEEQDIYIVTRATVNEPWSKPAPLPPFDTTKDHWRPGISGDNRAMFIGNNRDSSSSDEIGVAVRNRANDPWAKVVDLGSVINTSAFETDPYITADGSTLLFRRGTDKKGDIWEVPVLPFESVSMKGSGASYMQDFNSLGLDTSRGIPFPTGWTGTAEDVVFTNETTVRFPASRQNVPRFSNAGLESDVDRALVTDVGVVDAGELDLRVLVGETDLRAMRLQFDLEAWRLFISPDNLPREAAFQVLLEAADENGDFLTVKDFGLVTTGKKLLPPDPMNVSTIDGNRVENRVSFDSGPLDVDIPAGTTLRLRWIGSTEPRRSVVFGLDNVSLRFAQPGDANVDGWFDSTDIVRVFQVGEFEDNVASNSTWADGDWTGDQEFTSEDLVVALQSGGYGGPALGVAAVPEPTSMAIVGLALLYVAASVRAASKVR